MNIIRPLIILLALYSLVTPGYAMDKKVIEDYRKAESLFQAKQYKQALQIYRRLIGIEKHDRVVTLENRIEKRIINYGRAPRRINIDNSTKMDYQPNQRIQQISAILQEQYYRAHPPNIKVEWLGLVDPSRDNILDGGESAVFQIEISNVGESTARIAKLEIQVDKKQGLKFSNSVELGEIKTNTKKVQRIKVDAQRNIKSGSRRFTFRVKEKSGFDSNLVKVKLNTKKHQPPRIVLKNFQLKDFNGNGILEAKETAEVTATVRNEGKGVAAPILASLRTPKHVFIGPDTQETIRLTKVYPGQERHLRFMIIANKRIGKKRLQLAINLKNSLDNIDLNRVLTFQSNNQNKGTQISLRPKHGTNIAPGMRDFSLRKTNKVNTNGVAVIIGNKTYRTKNVPPVSYAHNDATAIKEFLVKTLGYRSKNIIYLQDATLGKFSEIFGMQPGSGKLADYVNPGKSEVFIYYSGHGAPDLNNHDSYFVPVDAHPNYLSNSGYSLKTFYRQLAALPAKKVIVVLDTCFSGKSAGGYLFKDMSPIQFKTKPVNTRLKNGFIFTSSSASQVSVWYHKKRHGLFTYYFLRGSAGHADGDNNGRITSSELNRYLKSTVTPKARRLMGIVQTPGLQQLRNSVLIDLNPHNVSQASP